MDEKATTPKASINLPPIPNPVLLGLTDAFMRDVGTAPRTYRGWNESGGKHNPVKSARATPKII